MPATARGRAAVTAIQPANAQPLQAARNGGRNGVPESRAEAADQRRGEHEHDEVARPRRRHEARDRGGVLDVLESGAKQCALLLERFDACVACRARRGVPPEQRGLARGERVVGVHR
jgi:hypothetical protein